MATLAKLEAAAAALIADTSAQPEQFCKLAHSASQFSNANSAAVVLNKLLAGTSDKLVLSVIHNNLACVEKRRGQLASAVEHLENAAQCEGGVSGAQPTTLLNLSAAYASLGKHDEAAALAHRAVLRAKQSTVPAAVRAAAYFNLGSALEATDQNDPALEAYRQAVQCAPTNRPQLKVAASSAITQLERKVAIAAPSVRDEWAKTVGPALQAHAARLPKLVKDVQQSRALVVSDMSQTESRSGLRKEFVDAYFASVRDYHCPAHPLTPEPYDDPARHLASLRVNYRTSVTHSQAIRRSVSATLLEDSPSWNYDPVLEPHETSHRLKDMPKDWLLIRAVDQRYIPRALVPRVEDIRYKECTRRSAIEKEYKKRLKVLWHHRDMAFIRAGEDSDRVAIEIEEVRVRRVLHQWIVGKRLFAEASLALARLEHQQRVFVAGESAANAASLEQYAMLLHPVAQEEHTRRNLHLVELDERRTLTVRQQAAIATLVSNSKASQKKRGTAYALALWCIESVIPEQELHKVEDKDRKLSLAVLERNTIFNRFLTAPR